VVLVLSNDELVRSLEQSRLDLDSAKSRLDQMRSPTSADISSAKAKLAQAQAQLDSRRLDVQKLTVTAPVSGRVSSVRANLGDTVAAGQTIVTVVDDSEVLAVAQVAQSDISKVATGQKAAVVFGSELPSAEGVVDSINPEAAASGKSAVIPVSIRLPNPNGTYRTGLMANASIKVSADELVYATATVSPKARYDVKAESNGTVDAMSVSAGDTVEKGKVLVKLSNSNLASAVAVAEADVQILKDAFDHLKSGLAPAITETEIKQQDTKIRQAELTLQNRQEDVANLTVKSPINGIIISRAVSVGDSVGANTNLFVVADYSKMNMVIPVDELDITHIQIGQKATVLVDALPSQEFLAEVTKIASEGTVREGVASYDVTLTMKETKGLKGSMTGNASIVVAQKDDVLLVPSEAITTIGGRKRVTILKDGKPVPTDVRVGLSNDAFTEVLSGVQQGDTLVISSLDRRGSGVQMPMIRPR
jgi:HlyD family secretion protein